MNAPISSLSQGRRKMFLKASVHVCLMMSAAYSFSIPPRAKVFTTSTASPLASSLLPSGTTHERKGRIIGSTREDYESLLLLSRRMSTRRYGKRGSGNKSGNKNHKQRISKSNLPEKICVVCGRPFTWRKKWERSWDEITCCSKSCNAKRRATKIGGDDTSA